MKVRPWGEDFMVGGFLSLVEYNFNSDSMESFEKDTGHNLNSIASARGLNAMIDEATGRKAEVIAAFGDWVAQTQWGIE